MPGLIVLPNKSLAHIARCPLASAETTHRSRCFSEAPWRADERNRRRLRLMLQQTNPHRHGRHDSRVVIDDTLCEHVGSLFDHVDRHDHHHDGTDPLAHHPVTSCSGSGPGRCPLGLRLYRRDEELTPWAAVVAKHVPALEIPTENKARNRLPTPGAPVWLQAPECRARPEPFRTTMALARRRKDGISRLNTNRRLQTASVQLRDAHGWTLQRPGPHMALEPLVPLIPANAYRPVTVGAHTHGCVTLTVRIPGLAKVRLVSSVDTDPLTGRSVVLVTNRVDWRAAKSIRLSWLRWPTEPLYQDGQGHLGFHAYGLRCAEAIGNHGCLRFVADSRWHLACRPAVPGRTRGLIHTMGDACRP